MSARESEHAQRERALRLHEPALSQGLNDHLRQLRKSLGPRLRPGFDALAARRRWLSKTPGHYTRPDSQPVVLLALLVAESLAERGVALPESAVLAALEAGLVGYGAVRVHDDWIDEGVGSEDPAATALLADALFSFHHAALARASAGAPEPVHTEFWALTARTWAEYGEAMLLERELLRGPAAGADPYDAAAFARVLLRSRPLILPAAALLARADRLELLNPLRELAHASTEAAQLLDDAVDVLVDFDAGRMNYLVQRGGGLGGRDALLLTWALGGFAEALDDVRRALAVAEEAAERLGIGRSFAPFLAARRATLNQLVERPGPARGEGLPGPERP